MVRLRGFQKLTSIEEATHLLLTSLKLERLGVVNVPLVEALNHVLAEDIIADEDLPRFDRSAVDGYAVRASDTFGASQFSPKILKLTTANRLTEGEAKEVWTGNPLPEGADAVVMLEHVKRLNNEIEVWVAVTPGENVSRKGED
ncbi:MAG: molybdopterin molybdenumtransferase MoeA, partial [Candidatus Bathyarchaeia archaeon]